ncbi:MAG: hypothetical protein ACHP78_12825 [Terriglobales bacterium]
MIAAAIFYYRLGQHEYGRGFATAGLSLAVSLVTQVLLGWGWLGFVVGQVCVLAALTWYNIRRHAPKDTP